MHARGALRPTDLGVVATCLVVIAAAVVTTTPRASGSEEAEAFFERMARMETATYRARQLVVYLGHPQSAAVLEVRSDGAGTYVRAEAGADVTRVWRKPGRGLVEGTDIEIEDLAPPRVPVRSEDVMRKYDVEVGEAGEQLGIEVVPLDLVRRMDHRLVERLWVSTRSGIVYRRELFGPTGALMGISQVLDMEWGEAGGAEPYDGPRPQKVEVDDEAEAPDRLAYGYRLVKGYRLDVEGRPAHHWVYTDGLHTLSVFRTPGRLSRPEHFEEVEVAGERAWAGPGPGTWTWEGDESTWVLVAEEPQLDPTELTDPFPMGGPSILSRLGSWWARVWRGLVELVS